MDHRLVRPTSLVIIKIVLGKSARIQDAKLRTDRRPLEWRWLPAIIKPRPHKRPRHIGPRRIIVHPLLRGHRPLWSVHVVRRKMRPRIVVEINPARADRAGLLRPDARLLGMVRMIIIGISM